MSRASRIAASTAVAALLVTAPAAATTMIGQSSAGTPNGTSANPSLAAGSRFVAFDSEATNLGPADPNGRMRDVFLCDSLAGHVELLSAPTGGGAADGPSTDPAANADGTRVAFTSEATNLVPFDRNGRADVFARDVLGGFVRVSEPEGAGEANGNSAQPDISADGRYVAFSSNASNLVYGDVNGHSDVFVRDLVTSQTRRVSVSSSGREGDGNSGAPAISADGRWVSFASTAANLVRGDRNRIADVFVHDLQTGRTERVSVSSRGREQNAAVIKPFTQVSDVGDNGRYVVFDSDADNLVGHDGNQDTDVFVRDRVRRRTSRVSVTARGREGNNDSFAPAMTPDTHFVVFESFAENLAPHNGPRENVFVRDVARGTTEVVDVSAAGRPAAPRRGPQLLQQAAIARDGSAVAFASRAGNLVPGDNNRLADLFLRIIAPGSR